MSGPNIADKYASVVTKNLDLGCNYQARSAGYFPNLLFVALSIQVLKYNLRAQWFLKGLNFG